MNEELPGTGLLKALQDKGWRIARSASSEPLLPPPVLSRYPRIPIEVHRFLEEFDLCINADENVWFLAREDYRRTESPGFRWNEFELITLDAAYGDPDWQKQIREYWNRHFPFMLAVHSDYDYLAISLNEESYGAVVYGYGPEFDNPKVIAPSFTGFLDLFEKEASGGDPNYPWSYFL